MKTLYTAEALATGEGRDGHGRTSDGTLNLDLAIPKEMGGSGNGTNPEQLFAAGYAACFHSALRLVARRAGVDPGESTVTAEVGIGPEGDAYGLVVTLIIHVPGLDREKARELAEAAHQVCPYSRATRGNISVELRVLKPGHFCPLTPAACNAVGHLVNITSEGLSYAQEDVSGMPAVIEFDPGSLVLTAFGRVNAGTIRGDRAVAGRFLNSFFRI